MRSLKIILISLATVTLFSSCNVWGSIFKPKYGCKSNGKNVGAEKILSGDAETMKSVRKAKKFKS